MLPAEMALFAALVEAGEGWREVAARLVGAPAGAGITRFEVGAWAASWAHWPQDL